MASPERWQPGPSATSAFDRARKGSTRRASRHRGCTSTPTARASRTSSTRSGRGPVRLHLRRCALDRGVARPRRCRHPVRRRLRGRPTAPGQLVAPRLRRSATPAAWRCRTLPRSAARERWGSGGGGGAGILASRMSNQRSPSCSIPDPSKKSTRRWRG